MHAAMAYFDDNFPLQTVWRW